MRSPTDATPSALAPYELLQRVLDSSHCGMLVLSSVRGSGETLTDFELVLLNQTAAADLGQPATELVGQRLGNLLGDSATATLRPYYEEVIRSGRAQEVEYTLTLPGRTAPDWFRSSIAPLGDGVTVSYDLITDLKLATADLEQQIRQYTLALNSTASGVVRYRCLYDESGQPIDLQAIYVNDSAVRVSGISRETFLSRSYSQISRGETRAKLLPWLLEVVRSGQMDTVQISSPDLGYWFNVTAIPHESEFLTLTYSDVTAIQQLQLQQKQTAARLRAVLDTAQSGLFMFEPLRAETADGQPGPIIDFLFTDANEMVAGLAGLTPKDLRGLPCRNLFRDYQQNGLFDRYRDIYEQEAAERFEFHYIGDGLNAWFDISAKRFGNELLVNFVDITASKSLLLEQQQTAEVLESVFQSALTGKALFGPIRDASGAIVDFRHLLVNQANVAASSYTQEELLGGTMLELYPDNRTNGLFNRTVEVAESGRAQRYEMHYLNDRLDIWLDIQLAPSGENVLFSFLDITANKRLQLANQRQAQLLQSVIDNSPTGLALLEAVRDETGTITDFRYRLTNPANARVLGLDVDSVQQHTVCSLQPSIRQTEFFQQLIEVTESGYDRNSLFHFNGELARGWFECTLTRQGDGVLFMFREVTEQKGLEEKLKSQANLLQSILDIAPVLIIVCQAIRDEQGVITDFRHVLVNSQACEWIGFSAEEFYQMTVRQMEPAFQNAEFFEQHVRVVEQNEHLQLDFERNGRWVDVHIVKFDDGFIAAAIDVTEVYRYRKALEAQNRDLERTNENLRQFAYVASHDLQEPLRKIQSFGDILQGRYAQELDTVGQDLIQRMQAASRRMSSLIHDLLMFSRVSNNEPVMASVNLNHLVEGVLQDLEVLVQESRAQIRVEALPTLTGDRLQLHQLFQNLLSNALKFRKPKGTTEVVVSCTRLLGKSVGLPGLRPNASYYRIDVTDNGIGFEEKYLDRIFQIFQRLHGKTSYSGTGIGLAICKKVVENHHGMLTARSQPGKGSTFTIVLPA